MLSFVRIRACQGPMVLGLQTVEIRVSPEFQDGSDVVARKTRRYVPTAIVAFRQRGVLWGFCS